MRIVVHFIGGIGRTGTMFGCVLSGFGFRGNDVVTTWTELIGSGGKRGAGCIMAGENGTKVLRFPVKINF